MSALDSLERPNLIVPQYELVNPTIVDRPVDLPPNYIAYNPSRIHKVYDGTHDPYAVVYLRVEPDVSNKDTSHLGKSSARPYIIDLANMSTALEPCHLAVEVAGEDPSLTRIKRRLNSGKIEEIWVLSVVDARPMPGFPNIVKSLRTRFYTGVTLDKLEHTADGPEGMKDIRLAHYGYLGGTALSVYGRPQNMSTKGNITHTVIKGIEQLTPDVIANAPYINEDFLPKGKDVWIGVNDIVRIAPFKNILVAHSGERTGADRKGRTYDGILLGHDTRNNTLVNLGVFASACNFLGGTVKKDDDVDTSNVVFPGGLNTELGIATLGVHDGCFGISGLRRII